MYFNNGGAYELLSNDNIGIRYQDTGIYGAGLILNCFGDVEIVLAGDNRLTVEERECLCGLYASWNVSSVTISQEEASDDGKLTVIGSEKADYRDCFGMLIQCLLTLESGVVEAGFVSEIEPVKHG